MFSGIVDHIGKVAACDEVAGGRKLRVEADGYWHDLAPGSSVAVDGVCLTIAAVEGATAEFDVVQETLRRTTLGDLRPGATVNLQKSLVVGDRVDGHFVQGHVDAVGVIDRIDCDPRETLFWFAVDDQTLALTVPKGSVAVDGISLTVVDLTAGSFSVALIPTTLDRTTLGRKRVGQSVNIETDLIARAVRKQLLLSQGGLAALPTSRSDD
jgi:riboflavin synthase